MTPPSSMRALPTLIGSASICNVLSAVRQDKAKEQEHSGLLIAVSSSSSPIDSCISAPICEKTGNNMSISDPTKDASTSVASSPQPPYPLHHSVADKLDPQYVAFYNKHIINAQQVHYQPVAASRVGGKIIPGGSDILPVGRTQDISIVRRETSGPDVKARCFVPEGDAPPAGWPAMIYYHGGGWVLGNIDTENTVCTNMCKRARWVVITTDYRYA